MPLDVGQFITPFPGPFRYSSPDSVPNAAELSRQRETERSNRANEALQQQQLSDINARDAAGRAWERQRFVAEGVRKKAEEARALQNKWLDSVIRQDWAGANALGAQLRSVGIAVEHVGPQEPGAMQTPEAAPTPAVGATSAPTPSGKAPKAQAPTEYPQIGQMLGPTPGVRALPSRVGGPATPEAQQRSDRQRKIAAFEGWRQFATTPSVPQPLPGPEETAQQQADRQARVNAFQIWRNQGAESTPSPPPAPMPGAPMGTPVPKAQKPGWVVRDQKGNETFRLNDEDVATWRGRTVAQHWAPFMKLARSPEEQRAVQKGMSVELAAVTAGLPMEKAEEAGQKAYQFEMEQANALKRAQLMANSMAARAERQDRIDPVKIREYAVTQVRQNMKTAALNDLQSTTQMLVKMLDEQGYKTGTLSNSALNTVIKAYGDSRISDQDYAHAAGATGLDAAVQRIQQYLNSEGVVPEVVMRQVHGMLRAALEKQTRVLQQAGDQAYSYVTDSTGIDPMLADDYGRSAGKTIYPYWHPPEKPAQKQAAPQAPAANKASSSSSAAMRFMVK